MCTGATGGLLGLASGQSKMGVGGLIPMAFAAQQRQATKKSAASAPGYGGVFTAENPPPRTK